MTVTALAREYPKNTVTIVMTVMQGIRVTVTAIGRGHPKTAVTTVTAVTQRAVTRRRKEDDGLCPIEAASTGDTEAIQAVLKHYEGYITVLATRKMFDEFGQVHYCVDETLRQRLEAKLITKTLGFDTKSYVRKSNQ